MASVKLSQIAQAGSPPSLTDTVIGVGSGTTDFQYTLSQIKSAVGGGGRTILTGNTNYYVSATGSDSNDGLSSGTSWATLQHAMLYIAENIDLAGFIITVNIGAGTFPGFGTTGCVGGGVIMFKGAGPSSTKLTGGPNDGLYNTGDVLDVFISPGGTAIALDSLNIEVPSTLWGVQIQNPPAVVYLGSPVGPSFPTTITVSFAAGGGGIAFATYATGGQIFTNNNAIAGSAIIDGVASRSLDIFYDAAGGGQIFDNLKWTVNNTPNWGIAFANAKDSGAIEASSVSSFTGSATGKRFRVSNNGIIGSGTNSVGFLGPTFYPGDTDGSGDSSSSYDGYPMGIVEASQPSVSSDLKAHDQWSIFRNSNGGFVPTIAYNNAGSLQYVARVRLSADLNVYVATTGSDSNDGLSSGTAWATLQHAIDIIASTYDIAGFTITVNIAAGTYVGFGLKSTTGGGIVAFVGAGSGSTIIQDGPSDGVYNFGECATVNVISSTILSLNKVTFQNLNNSLCVAGYQTSIIIFGEFGVSADIVFDSTPAISTNVVAITSQNFAFVLTLGGTYSVTGNNWWNSGIGFGFLNAAELGELVIRGTWTISGGPSIDPFLEADTGGFILVTGLASFSGAVTGHKFFIATESAINKNGGATIPGSIAGLADPSCYFNGSKTTMTVAQLNASFPAGSYEGGDLFVSDSTATIAAGLGNTVVGSGANKVPVYSDGANWIIG